ncbi:MAG TPA: CcmD family protein [Vicinamibacterales bacterium]|mgnify:CR=1 FL=1|nr:CcmD family protein [Vicinamibacterales bacterium]HOQ60085.1 CcmD family protein [Vicinamibacterales bacterium]HPW21457.1 CcmD family protein [Vicinamibacterales bacterium]
MKRLLLALALAALVSGPVLQAWQPAPPQPGTPGDYVPIASLPQAERLPAAPFLIAAYALVWAVLVAYTWSLWRRITKLEREMKDLGRRLPKA